MTRTTFVLEFFPPKTLSTQSRAMKATIIFLCLWALAVTGFSPFGDVRQIFPTIVGGQQARKGDFKYQVSLQFPSNGRWRHFCGGSIVAADKVITAAHCIYGHSIRNIRVVAGEYRLSQDDETEQIVSVLTALIHPAFNYNTGDYDYAILRLSSPFRLGDHASTIPLATAEYDPCGNCVSTGWGSINGTHDEFPDVLHFVTLPIVGRRTCAETYANFPFEVTDRMVCAGGDGKNSCHGDSGGPLACEGILVGIVSWGIYPCGQKEYPSVYANIAAVRSWFDEYIQ